METIINPLYSELKDFITGIPSFFEKKGKSIYKGRNEIKTFEINGLEIAAKSFKKPHFINRIAYTFFRKSKARRSYEHALILQEKKITTPQPIAFIEEKKNGLISGSYYISTYKEYPGIMREFRHCPLSGKEDLVRAFARFTAFVHEQGVLHLDYSPGNILYEKTASGYDFCLIDINRMKFGEIDMKTACRNLQRLWGSDEMIAFTAKEYANARGFDEKTCIDLTLKYHREFWKKYTKKYPERKAYMGEKEKSI